MAVAAGVLPGMLSMVDPDLNSSLLLLFVAMVLLAAVLGPCNTVTADVVPASRRAAGYALSIFLIHLFGDISSPLLIGVVSDWAGSPRVADSPFGHFLAALGAAPVKTPTGPTNLTLGMLSVVPVLLLGCLFFLTGSRHLAADQDRAQLAGGGEGEDGVAYH